tara:strand:+ start:1039 stop:1446 length:408 start_codon:yes stop_codon:yes gene_type:complete
MQVTFVVIKPDAVKRGLMGEVLSRFEQKGFKIRVCRYDIMTRDQARSLYLPHARKEFYGDLVGFMVDGASVQMIVGRDYAVSEGRALVDRIRDDLATSVRHNVVHASDSIDSALREMDVFWPGTSGIFNKEMLSN